MTALDPKGVYVCGVARTPMGSLGGSLSTLTSPQLGAIVIRAALQRAGVKPDAVQELFMGNVLTGGVGQAPARQAAIAAGLPVSVVCTTVNKVCASGTKAIILGAQSILLGTADVVVVGGMESMSNAPYYAPRARQGLRLGDAQLVDGLIRDGLWDPYQNVHMGVCAELCAREHGITRGEQDAHAAESFARAAAAAAAGAFDSEIVPVHVPQKGGGGGKGAPPVSADEGAKKGGDLASLARLGPAFQKAAGTVTAGNSSSISDGAAALVLVSGARAAALGLRPLGLLAAWGEAAQEPERFTTAPALAIPIAIKRAGLQQDQIDCFEINEAFSVVSLANNKLLRLDPSKVNIFGGAVALGHPIGCSGARVAVTLLSALRHRNGRYGVAAICNGGGGASALVIEAMPPAPTARL